MNWLECTEVEAVAGKVGGRPVIKGTRIEPMLVLMEAALGRTPEQTHQDFPSLSVNTIRAIQAFGEKHKPQLVP